MAARNAAGMRQRLYRPLPLCLSVAAHLAALLLLSQHMGSHGASAQMQMQMQMQTQMPMQAPRMLQVSLVQPSSPSTMPSPAMLPPLRPAPQSPQLQRAIYRPAAVAAASPARAPGTAAPENAAETPQPPQQAETAAGTMPEPRYYLLRELSVRPRVLEDRTASLAFEGVPAQTVILRLFINEDGGIDRVAAEQSVLPDAHAQQLIDTFAQARFMPGQIDGAPVKSQMRIEVRLESMQQRRDVSLQ